MKNRVSIFWTAILIATQLFVIAESIAPHLTPLARQFSGWSAYAAMLWILAISFLVLIAPLIWRSHRRLAISGLCVACGAVALTTFSW